MPAEQSSEKLGVVWASVFLTSLIAWGVTMAAISGDRSMTPVAVTLVIGLLPGFVIVPMLLAIPGANPAVVMTGRVLVWCKP